MKQLEEQLRKIRNTMRFCLGNLNDTDIPEAVLYNDLPKLEKYMVNRMALLKNDINEYVNNFQYSKVMNALIEFCNETSQVYFDARKDSLYCDTTKSNIRKASLYVLSLIFDFLAIYASPVIPFSVGDAYKCRTGSESLQIFTMNHTSVELPVSSPNSAVLNEWYDIKALRSNVLLKLENMRADGLIKSNREATVEISVPTDKEQSVLLKYDLRDLLNVSDVAIVVKEQDAMNITVNLHNGKKCPRCWIYHNNENEVCERCENACTE